MARALARPRTPTEILTDLENSGSATDTALILTDPEMAYDTYEALGAYLGNVHRRCSWYIGDWLIFGENLYGEKYAQAAEATGLAPQTLMNRSAVCRAIPQSVRRASLSFSVHAEVAALKPNRQRHWLARAEREHLTREQLRTLLREERLEDLPTENGQADNGGPPAGKEPAAASPSVGSSVDAVLEAIRAVTQHAVPLDAKTVAVRRKDLENLQAFLGDE